MSDASFKQKTIAIVYDFDGTLTPEPMQNYAILPKLGITPDDFWPEVGEEVAQTGAENMLVYMRKLLEKADQAKVHITKEDYADLAKNIQYYKGVETWFTRLNDYVADKNPHITLKHYIVSAGMKEILEGVAIKDEFDGMYASEYFFNFKGIATFPKLVITDTSKTQFLFRINKGIEDLSQSINNHMPESERPIPFSNMIYIGDGLTDVPSMALTRKEGGHAIAVYEEDNIQQQAVSQALLKANRVDFAAPADYTQNAPLDQKMRLLLNYIIAGIEYREMVQNAQSNDS